MTRCVVFGCKNSIHTTKYKKPMVGFYTFSKKSHQQDRMKIWISFIRRSRSDPSWAPTNNSTICSYHFIGNEKSEDPRSPSYNPTKIVPDVDVDSIKDEPKLKRFKRFKQREANSKKTAQIQESSNYIPEEEIIADIPSPISTPTPSPSLPNKVKCLVCDSNLVDVNGDDNEMDDDISLDLVYHRNLLLSIFCKYFNWENNCNLTPSQLLSWIPSSSSSPTSSFPFCLKCEDKMNELNDLDDTLAKIQLSISTLISSISMEIIKAVESSSAVSASLKSKPPTSKSPLTTTTGTSCNEDKGACSSRRLLTEENEVQTFGAKNHENLESRSKVNESISIAKFNSQDPKSIGEFRRNVYEQFKPNVIVQDCKTTENVKRTTTSTTTVESSKIRRIEREEKGKDKQTVTMTMAPNIKEEEDCDTMTIKDEPLSPAPAYSPDYESSDYFDNGHSDNNSNATVIPDTGNRTEMTVADPRRARPKPNEPSSQPPSSPIESIMKIQFTSFEQDKDKDKQRSEQDGDSGQPKEMKISKVNHAIETEPGSNIFRYVNWEFAKLSEKSYTCLSCGFTNYKEEGGKNSMMRHINRYHNDVRPRCDACQNSWSTQELKDRHNCRPLVNKPKPAQEVSLGKFLYLDKFLYQKVDKDSNDKGFEYMCLQDNCRKLTRLASSIHEHIKQCHVVSNTSFMCDICRKTWSSVAHLKLHKASHSNVRNEICDICEKGFKLKSTLRLHRATHEGPFVCDFEGCGKKYSSPKNLKRHRDSACHPAEKKQFKLVKCTNCGKKLVGEARLAKHSLKCLTHNQKINCRFCEKEMLPHSMRKHLKNRCPQNPDYPERMNKTNGEDSQSDKGKGEEEQQQPKPTGGGQDAAVNGF